MYQKCYQLGKSGILKADITDHFTIFTILVSISKNESKLFRRNISKKNISKFKKCLMKTNCVIV